jgi:hypothetical protein
MIAAFVETLGTPRYLDWITTVGAERDTTGDQIHFADVSRDDGTALTKARATARVDTPQPRHRTEAATTDTAGAPVRPAQSASMSAATSGVAAGTRDGDGREGVTLVPANADPRIWGVRPMNVAPGMTHAEQLETSLARVIAASNDSIAAIGVQTIRPDWVAGRGGNRVGVDSKRIYLGKASVPAVLLGLLPIRGFGCMPTMHFPDRPVRDSIGISCIRLENPTVAERAARIDEMSAEIRARAPLTIAANEEIGRIAARKDRERAARLKPSPTVVAGESPSPVRPPWQ